MNEFQWIQDIIIPSGTYITKFTPIMRYEVVEFVNTNKGYVVVTKLYNDNKFIKYQKVGFNRFLVYISTGIIKQI